MKRILLFVVLSLFAADAVGQTNRYGMELSQKKNGEYVLKYKDYYAPLIDLDKVPDLLVPFRFKAEKLHSGDWAGVRTVDYTFKSYPGYDLKLTVDLVDSEGPAPFMVYVHGGSWTTGNRGSQREISQYTAKNGGVAGVRISYTLSGQPGANVLVSIEDVKDAVKFVKDHSAELNIDTTRFGFLGTSSGGHLAAVAAMSVPGTKVLVGIVGVYDLPMLARMTRQSDAQLERYFENKDPEVLAIASPVNLIPDADIPAVLLIHGTGDLIVSYQQSVEFADALKKKGAEVVDLNIYPFYGHNIVSRATDMKEECFFKAYDFIVNNLK